MNGHDDYFDNIKIEDQDKEFDEEGNLVDVEDEEDYPNLSNPMCDYSPQEELDRVSNRESYQFFRGY